MPGELHISSLLVHARPDTLADVSASVLALGCEIHGTSEAGKLVVTFETESEAALSEVLTKLQLADGVLAATLVFHHVEPAGEPPATAGNLPDAAGRKKKETRSCR